METFTSTMKDNKKIFARFPHAEEHYFYVSSCIMGKMSIQACSFIKYHITAGFNTGNGSYLTLKSLSAVLFQLQKCWGGETVKNELSVSNHVSLFNMKTTCDVSSSSFLPSFKHTPMLTNTPLSLKISVSTFCLLVYTTSRTKDENKFEENTDSSVECSGIKFKSLM